MNFGSIPHSIRSFLRRQLHVSRWASWN